MFALRPVMGLLSRPLWWWNQSKDVSTSHHVTINRIGRQRQSIHKTHHNTAEPKQKELESYMRSNIRHQHCRNIVCYVSYIIYLDIRITCSAYTYSTYSYIFQLCDCSTFVGWWWWCLFCVCGLNVMFVRLVVLFHSGARARARCRDSNWSSLLALRAHSRRP